MNERNIGWIITLVLIVVTVAVLFGMLWTWKSIKVWSRAQDGKAELAEAEFSRRVQIEEAKGNLEAEKLNALAEVERAKGAAEAIKIEGGTLTQEYIQYLWVRQNRFNDKTTIYIPTEANLPILEANPNR